MYFNTESQTPGVWFSQRITTPALVTCCEEADRLDLLADEHRELRDAFIAVPNLRVWVLPAKPLVPSPKQTHEVVLRFRVQARDQGAAAAELLEQMQYINLDAQLVPEDDTAALRAELAAVKAKAKAHADDLFAIGAEVVGLQYPAGMSPDASAREKVVGAIRELKRVVTEPTPFIAQAAKDRRVVLALVALDKARREGTSWGRANCTMVELHDRILAAERELYSALDAATR